MIIRLEQPDDYADILQLTHETFQTLDYPGRRRMNEHYLIHLLRGSEHVIPELSFVAEKDGEAVGHILYTHSRVLRPDGIDVPTVSFGPLSVLPEYHRTGIGRSLVEHSIDLARDMGYGAVMITGVPDYYPRLGFARAREYDITLSDGSAEDSFMAYELIPVYLGGGGIFHFDANDIFEQAENDDDGFADFHEQFMIQNYPGKPVLRSFFEVDIDIVKRWLHKPHIAKWFHFPGELLDALENRRGEFDFINPFIIEYEGHAIGFCRFYDCYHAKNYEDWKDELPSPEHEGEVYSMDCLIGEPEYLYRGFGRDIILQMIERLKRIGAREIHVKPEKENVASHRVLEAAGFRHKGEDYVFVFDN